LRHYKNRALSSGSGTEISHIEYTFASDSLFLHPDKQGWIQNFAQQ